MLLSLLLFFSPLIHASPNLKPQCIPLTHFASRTGRTSCWAQFHLSAHDRICIPHALWIEWLHQQDPSQICLPPNATWKIYSPPLNDLTLDSKIRIRTHTLKNLAPEPQKITLSTHTLALHQKIELFREFLSQRMRTHDSLGLLRSLILHEHSPHSPLPILRLLGFVHLASASGIHLFALSQWVHTSLSHMGRFSGLSALTTARLSRRFAFILCLFVWLLSGARIGLLRPWGILLLKQLAQTLGFQWKNTSPLFCALALETLTTSFNPQSGQWIYALAVGGGMLGYQRGSHWGMALGSWALPALFEIWTHGTVALATAPLSILTVPVLALGMYPLTLLSCLLPHAAATWILHSTAAGISKFILYLTDWSLHLGNLWVIPRYSLLLSSVLALASIHLKKRMRLSLFIVLISFLCIRSLHLLQPTRAHTEPQRPILARQIQQLDVGQGDAALIQQQTGEWGLLDTGDSHAIKDLDWIELFAHRGITQLAWIAFTHLDSDHTGALFRLARLIPIGCVTTSQAEWETPRGQRMRQRLTQLRIPALDWSSHCMPFPVLDPPPTQNLKDGNARMSAILVPTPHGYYLNAGDSDLHQEHRVLQWISKTTHVNQPCLILKISHHGSRFATSQDWLSILQPKQAWISSGAGNTYGHPHPRVLQILHSLHIPTHRTDQEGVLQTP